MHVSLAQYLHREDLVKAAEHSTDPDQEACPHHGLIRMDPGATDKSVDLRSAAWNTLDNEESFRMTTEDSENLWVSMSLKIKHVCLPLAKSLPFITLHRKRGRQTMWIYIFTHLHFTELQKVKWFMNAILCLTKVQVGTSFSSWNDLPLVEIQGNTLHILPSQCV